jgi:hypothetical protein
MNLVELAQKSFEKSVPSLSLADHIGISGIYVDRPQERLRESWITFWCNGDSWDGVKAYYFDTTFVAISKHLNDCVEVKWVGYYDIVHAYVSSFFTKEDGYTLLSTEELEEIQPKFFHVSYSSSLLDQHSLFYQGIPVTLHHKAAHGISTSVEVAQNGKIIRVDVKDLDISYGIK